ncbi:MAG: hypothetical protein JW751_18100 [Polyangiaceae bacterium]|nr:hypothetical protein [Polyangiaceae bacterium]
MSASERDLGARTPGTSREAPETAASRRIRARIERGRAERLLGWPVGSTDDLLALAVPPLYSPCPSPFFAEFLQGSSGGDHRAPPTEEPYRGPLRSHGRHPVGAFHPYHTKVPPDVIRALIEHYTAPGEIVLDAFCGSGMTGVAAREAGRHAILTDLSPLATFIAGVNTRSHDGARAADELEAITAASEAALGALFTTVEDRGPVKVRYFVWTDVFACPACGEEFPFFPHGVIHHGDRVQTRSRFPCPGCGGGLDVRSVRRVIRAGRKLKALAWVSAGQGKGRLERPPNATDLALAEEVEARPIPMGVPRDGVDPTGYSARLAQLGGKRIDDVTCFFSRRNLLVLSDLWRRVAAVENPALRNLCRAALTSVFTVVSERQGYFGGGGGMSGNLYMPIVRMERNPYDSLRRKIRRLVAAERLKAGLTTRVLVSTQSATSLADLPDASVDYVYTDPPFGANIIYSEVNLLLEAWLRVRTDRTEEVVIDPSRGRRLTDYARLATAAFREYFRVLRPGRWLTVEFHNTTAAVWEALQRAVGEAGFQIVEIGLLDKGSTTLLADIRPAAAKCDLLITARKPRAGVTSTFALVPGARGRVWEVVREELAAAPLPTRGDPYPVVERQPHLLFDRMVAAHVAHKMRVPISALTFRRQLARRFPERGGMYFLPEQLRALDDE